MRDPAAKVAKAEASNDRRKVIVRTEPCEQTRRTRRSGKRELARARRREDAEVVRVEYSDPGPDMPEGWAE